MNPILEKTKDFIVYEHAPDENIEIVDRYKTAIGIFFIGEDAVKAKKMILAPLKPTETPNKRLRKSCTLARRNIDRGLPKL